MVLSSSLSRPLLGRSVGSTALRNCSRGFHNVSAASAIASSNLLRSSSASSSTAGLASRRAAVLPPNLTTKLGPSTTTRSLTGFPREKVKVLMVLYDGGKHAEEVSFPPPKFCFYGSRHELPTARIRSIARPRQEETPTPTQPCSPKQHARREVKQLKGGGIGMVAGCLNTSRRRMSLLVRHAVGTPTMGTVGNKPRASVGCEEQAIVEIHRWGLRGTVQANHPIMLTGSRSAWHHPERARHSEMARGPGSHPHHHLRQGGRELQVRPGARRCRDYHHHPVCSASCLSVILKQNGAN